VLKPSSGFDGPVTQSLEVVAEYQLLAKEAIGNRSSAESAEPGDRPDRTVAGIGAGNATNDPRLH
jgi:hypothetical protein